MPVLGFYLLEVKKSLVCAFFHLYHFYFPIGLLVDLETLDFGTDFCDCGVENLFFLDRLCQRSLHLGHLFIKLNRPTNLFENSKEAAFSFDHQVLDLALLNDLKLRITVEGEAAAFKYVEKFLLADWLAIDAIVFLVRLAVITLP